MQRLTVIYEVPDDYKVTRITGTGELNVVRCESMDVMQELGKATARLASAEAFVAKHKCQTCGGVRVREAELCCCDEVAKGGRDE